MNTQTPLCLQSSTANSQVNFISGVKSCTLNMYIFSKQIWIPAIFITSTLINANFLRNKIRMIPPTKLLQ